MEAVVEDNNALSFCEAVLDDDSSSEENTSKRHVRRRRLSAKDGEGRSNTSIDSIQHFDKEDIHSSDPTLNKETEECEVVFQKVTDKRVDDGEVSILKQTLMKDNFSLRGSSRQTHSFPGARTDTPTSLIDTLMKQWSIETGVAMDTNTTPQRGKSARKQPRVSITKTRSTQKKNTSCVQNENAHHLQKGNNATPAEDEDVMGQPCTSTPHADPPQKKTNTLNARKKGSKKHPSAPEGDQHHNTTTPAPHNTTTPAPQPSQSQKKSGVRRNAKIQHCARTMIYECSKRIGSFNLLQKMENLGKIINLTKPLKKKAAKMNCTNTLGECIT